MQKKTVAPHVLSVLQEKDSKAKVESVEEMWQQKWKMSFEVDSHGSEYERIVAFGFILLGIHKAHSY